MVEIRTLTVAEFAARPELPALLAEYRAESAVPEYAGNDTPQWGTYDALEAAGLLTLFCAFVGAELIGFASLLVSRLPHFGTLVASTESYFVASRSRGTGAGLALLRAVEKHARESGATGLLVSSPAGSRLEQVLERTDMRRSHAVFFKPLTGQGKLPALAPADRALVEQAQALVRELPQLDIPTEHLLHAGLYARTVRIPAGSLTVGAHMRRATVLVLNGDATMFVGGEERERRYTGYHVLAGAAGRKSMFLAHADTSLTMLLPTGAQTVEQAENEFTDEAAQLLSRVKSAASAALLEG